MNFPANDLKERFLQYSFFAVAFSLCWPIKATTYSLALFLVAAIVNNSWSSYREMRKDSLFWLLMIYLLLLVSYSFFDPNPGEVVKFLERYLPFLLIPMFVFTVRRFKNIREFTPHVVVASAVLAVVVTIIRSFQHISGPVTLYEYSTHLTNATLILSNYLAIYVSMAILFLFDLVLKKGAFKAKNIAFLIICFLVAFLMVLSARASFFTIILLAGARIVHTLYQSGKAKWIPLVGLLCISVIVLPVIFIPYFKTRIVTFYTHGFEADHRYFEWKAAYTLISEGPFYGYGITTTRPLLKEEYIKMSFPEGIEEMFNSHNQILESTLHFGIFGFIAIVGIYLLLFRKAVIAGRFMSLAFVVLFFLCSMTEALLERNKGIMFLSFFTALLLYQGSRPGSGTDDGEELPK